MIFSVYSGGIEWSLAFGPDSVTPAVKDFVQKMTISSQKSPLAAWSLLLSQRKDLLNNPYARVSNTLNQQRIMVEIRDEIISSVVVQDMDTSKYQVSDLDDIEIY